MRQEGITYTTATELARAEGVTKQSVSKMVKKLRDLRVLKTHQEGREVFFDVNLFKKLRAHHGDPARANLSPARDDPASAGDSFTPADANGVRTHPAGNDAMDSGSGVTPNAATLEAQRYNTARASSMELDAANKMVRLKRELGQLVSRATVDAEIQKLLGPIRAMMIDNAPDLARKLTGLDDEREITSAIREHYRFTLNEFTEKLRARDVSDPVGQDAGERVDGDTRSDDQSIGGAAAA